MLLLLVLLRPTICHPNPSEREREEEVPDPRVRRPGKSARLVEQAHRAHVKGVYVNRATT